MNKNEKTRMVEYRALLAKHEAGELPLKRTVISIGKNRVREIRELLGLTQVQFSSRFGITLATLRNIEQGHREPGELFSIFMELVASDPEGVSGKIEDLRLKAIPGAMHRPTVQPTIQ